MPSPIMSATIQAAALSTASNLFAQVYDTYRKQRPLALDLQQLARFLALTLMTTPPNYMWQQFLERSFPAYQARAAHAQGRRRASVELKALEDAAPQTSPRPAAGALPHATPAAGAGDGPGAAAAISWRNTGVKWFVDCITLGAIFNTVAFLAIMGVLKGQPCAQILYNIETETIPIIVAGYKIWPAASFISFRFVPVHRRIVFLSLVGFVWGVYMSLVAARV